MDNKKLECTMWFVVETLRFWLAYNKQGTLNLVCRNELFKEYEQNVKKIISKMKEDV